MHPTTRKAAFDLSFLSEISYVQAAFHFQAEGPVDLPPFGGSTLRGVFGRAFRRHLCTDPRCEEDCLRPEECRYYSLFERDRESPGKGASLPKPYILEPPVHPQLERIAAGAPVRPPFVVDHLPGHIPILRNEDAAPIPDGAILTVRMTLFGQVIPMLPAVIDVLARSTLLVGQGALHLVRVTDPVSGLPLYDCDLAHLPIQSPQPRTLAPPLSPAASPPARLQVSFVTPTRVRVGDDYCFEPARFAAHFWEAALTRAMRIRDFLCRPASPRLPFLELPADLPHVAGHTLYHYALRRMSHRQRRFMDFDGVVGSVLFEGALEPLLPLAHAAELLHIGQKATFGLGRVHCWLHPE
jgi:hypothetical protein